MTRPSMNAKERITIVSCADTVEVNLSFSRITMGVPYRIEKTCMIGTRIIEQNEPTVKKHKT